MQLMRRTFDDIDELCHTLKEWDLEMYPLSSSSHVKTAGNVVQVGFDGGLYSYGGFSGPLRMFGSPPGGLITFNVMEPSERDYWWRGHNLDSTMVWVFPVGGELSSISPPGFRIHTLSVTEELMAEVAAEYAIDVPSPSKRPEVFQAPDRDMHSIRSILRRMNDRADPFLHEGIREILPLLLSLWLKPAARGQRNRPSMRTRDHAVRKSLEIIDACNLATLRVQALLENCQVSKRTLEYAFRERFDASPSALIKSMRLAATKGALRRAVPGEQTVAEIAGKFGFWHPAQFATDYRKTFGELPSETLRKLY